MKQPTIEQVAAIAWDLLRDDGDPMFSHSLKDHQESCVYAAETVASSGIGETPYEKQVLRVLHNLEAALADATRMNNTLTERESAEAMQAIAKTGKTTIYTPTSQEMAQWRQVLLPVHKKMEERIGKDLLASVYKALAKAPDQR